jgi:hypothetical protein
MERDSTAVRNKNRSGERTSGAYSGDTEVHSITDAGAAHSEEMRQRMIKYAVAMGIRMVCLILVFVVDGWFKILPVIGAVFLPWFAVVIANGGDHAEVHSESLIDYVPLGELDAPRSEGDAGEGPVAGGPPPADDASTTLLQGELINDDLMDDDEDHGQAAS